MIIISSKLNPVKGLHVYPDSQYISADSEISRRLPDICRVLPYSESGIDRQDIGKKEMGVAHGNNRQV